MFITADPSTIANIWTRTRAMLVRAGDEIGAVAAIAASMAISRGRKRQIASWIALLETIVRKLLLAEAAALLSAAAANASRGPRIEYVSLSPGWTARLPPRMRRGAARSEPQTLDPANPESWRVRFAFKPPRDPRLCEGRQAPRALWGKAAPMPQPNPAHTRQITSAPLRLAMRLEALRRVIADPAPHAKRLARVLPRLCRRYADAAMRYALATARPHRSDYGDPRLILDAMGIAFVAAPIFLNSS